SVQANPVNLLVVAMVAKWHGIDRVINGLKLYYRNVPETDVLLHIVGEGPAIPALKKLVQINHLEDKVIFYGIVKGEQLDAIFDKADMGIASLGCHRKRIFTASDLKSREYSIRGLPFVVSVNLRDYPSGFPYVKYFPTDDSPIDIKEVVNFYNQLQEQENYSEHLRNWAKNNLSWTRKMQPVIEKIKQCLK
ncbi:MAG: glycosyltransferase, partial [Parabacteroides sp.]|nr:glycosyltransferase [Parabacteroides sp.]